MPLGSCNLLSFPEELLVDIISYCDWKEVLALQSTCKDLYRLCQVRPVWSALLGKLDDEQSPDLPPHILPESLSAAELQDVVISGLRSKALWYKDPNVVKLRRVEELHVRDPSRSLSSQLQRVDVRLLPGGKHVLVENDGALELWSIVTSRRLWTAPTQTQRDNCVSFDFEIAKSGKELMIAAVFLTPHVHTTYVRVFSFDFEREESELWIERVIPTLFLFRLMIRSDTVMIHIPHEFQVILIKWKCGDAVIADFTDSSGLRLNARAALISGQDIIVVLHAPEFCMIALSLSQLDGRWSRNPDFNEWQITRYVRAASGASSENVRIVDSTSVIRLNKFDGVEGPWVLALHSFTPTWRRGEDGFPEIIVVAYDRLDTKRLLTYKVQVLPATDASVLVTGQRFRLLAEACAPAMSVPWNPNCITNAGRMFTLHDGLCGFTPFTDAKQPSKIIESGIDVRPEREPTMSAVEPYSGAIAIGTPGRVRVLYLC